MARLTRAYKVKYFACAPSTAG